MPFAINENVKIYYEVKGKGSPLVLAHGLSGNLKVWEDLGYINALMNDFQLIAFDARGHGKSDKPHRVSEYGLQMVEDVISILNNMGISKANYFGYSMGARMGFRIATRHADRLNKIILGGASPYRSEAESKVEKDLTIEMQALLDNPEAGIKLREKRLGRSLADEEKKTLLANDIQALLAAVSSYAGLKPLGNEELSRIKVPCLLFCGKLDTRYAGAEESAKHIPQVKFIPLAGLDHSQAFNRSDLVIPYLKEFLL